ncbi:MAG: MFS transporter [Cellulosilyticaceae bacterium]
MESKKAYKYVVWGIATCIYIIVFFHRVALGAMKDALIVDFGIQGTGDEGSLFALLGAMYMYAYMFMQIPTGILADTLGARKTITVGSLVAVIGGVGFSLSQALWVAFICRFVVGIGVAVVFVCVLKLISEWFPKEKFATMSGITSFIGNMGAILAMTPLVFLNSWIGWRNALLMIAGIHLVLAVLCFIIIKEKEETKKAPPISGKAMKEGIKSILKDKGLYPIMIAYPIIFGSTMALTGTWGVSMMEDLYHISKAQAANLMSLITLGVAIGCICIGKLSDRMKSRKKPMVIFCAIHLVCWLVLVGFLPPMPILIPLLFVLGFTGTSFIVSWAYAKERHPKEYAATAMSVVNFAGFLGGALVPQLVGVIYDHMSKEAMPVLWRTALWTLTGLIAIACVCFLWIKENKSEAAS